VYVYPIVEKESPDRIPKNETSPDQTPSKSVVRLVIPAKVGRDINSLQKVLQNFAEEQGHPTCYSGSAPLVIEHEEVFKGAMHKFLEDTSVVDPESLKVRNATESIRL